MCSNIPKYLNEDLFRDALNDGFKRNDVTIKSLNLKLTSEGGENYCSDIYRATVEYTTDDSEIENIALIVKNMKDSVSDEIPMPSKESDMYTLLAPKLDELLGEADVLVPKYFRASNELYIFQDLGALGYTVQDRLKGLNESQTEVLLKKIAVFHAASMVVVKKHPDLIEKVGKSIFEEGIEQIPIGAELAYGNLEYFTDLAKGWDGFEEIVIKLQKLRNTYNDKLIAMVNSTEGKFKVFNHGDLWVNNMLFKHAGETCIDARLIDFQNCSYGSPGFDLHYFFATSVPMELALTKKYDLLRTYYKTLKATLLQLKYSAVPTWADLLNEMRVTEFYSVQAALLAVPLIFLTKDVSKGSDLDSLKDPDFMKNQRVHYYNSARTLAITRYIFDRMNDLGILD